MLLSIVVGNILIPLWAARETTLRRGLQKTIRWMLAWNLFYALSVRYL
jgi:hypothetical protein